MHSDYRSMAFLLSLGALPIACNNDEKDDGTAAGTTSTTMSSAPATTGTTTDATTTGTGTTDSTSPTESTTPTTTSTDPTADPTPGTATESTSPTNPTESTTVLTTDTEADTSSGATDGLPPTDDPTCLAYAAKLTECFPRYADYRQMSADYCAYYKMTGLTGDGQGCVDALEAQYVCLSQLACADFENEPCAPEYVAAETACPNLNSSESDTGGFGDTGSDT